MTVFLFQPAKRSFRWKKTKGTEKSKSLGNEQLFSSLGKWRMGILCDSKNSFNKKEIVFALYSHSLSKLASHRLWPVSHFSSTAVVTTSSQSGRLVQGCSFSNQKGCKSASVPFENSNPAVNNWKHIMNAITSVCVDQSVSPLNHEGPARQRLPAKAQHLAGLPLETSLVPHQTRWASLYKDYLCGSSNPVSKKKRHRFSPVLILHIHIQISATLHMYIFEQSASSRNWSFLQHIKPKLCTVGFISSL